MGVNCPFCGAHDQVDVCEYCGSALETERSAQPQTVIVNHYYGGAGDEGRSYDSTHAPYVVDARYGDDASPKSRTIALILAFFLGFFGVHRFYAGRIGWGLAFFFTFGFFTLGWLVDVFIVAFGRMKDSSGRLIARW